MISFNHIYPMLILDFHLLVLMMLDIIFMFPIHLIKKNFTAAQPIKVEFEFHGVVPNDINGYALN